MRLFILFFGLLFLVSGCAMFRPIQKSKLLPVFHLIEGSRFNEAKGVIDDLIGHPEAAGWPRTWYARGLLSHNAWREGISKNDRKLTELYPDQLYVVFESYRMADSLDIGGRLNRQLRPRYVMLANDFQRFGERQFVARNFGEALRAFEHSLKIAGIPELKLKPDSNLLYNAALAAYDGNNWSRAITHLNVLNQNRHSANVAHLLFNAWLAKADTLSAEKVMLGAIEAFPENEILVLLLADLYENYGQPQAALSTLNEAIQRHPDNYIFHNSKGMIYQKQANFQEAIDAYLEARRLSPENIMVFVNLATCYYNIGVEIERNSLSLTNISQVMIERERSGRAFQSAISWLDKAYEADSSNRETLVKLLDLYRALRITDKVLSLETKIR